MVGRRSVRLVLAALVLSSSLVAFYGLATADAHASPAVGDELAPPREGVTVITTDSNTWLGRESDSPRSKAEILALGPDGRVVYYNDSHTRYWDVDPVPGTAMTVEYVYADHLSCGETACTRNGVERVNLSTGEVTAVYSRITAGKHSTRWHDVDRLDGAHLLVADIAHDEAFVVNTTAGVRTWTWNAQSAFDPRRSGGPFPEDWTHLNDVEAVGDGRVMLSLRNHDRVVFVDREGGYQPNWTLGSEDEYGTLYEQHNPDYIPGSAGGPAVLVSDSENGRLVEYQYEGGDWQRTWTWTDDRLQWPRDADRLPNGHTLVTDSNGDRVFEVGRDGEVVWSVDVAFPYEAERLSTGDESTGGPSARRADLASRTAGGRSAEKKGGGPTLDSVLEGPLVNGVVYVLPVWVGATELLALTVCGSVLLVWGAVEWRWSGRSLAFRVPITVRRR